MAIELLDELAGQKAAVDHGCPLAHTVLHQAQPQHLNLVLLPAGRRGEIPPVVIICYNRSGQDFCRGREAATAV